MFCGLVAVMAALVLYSLYELDNPLVVPQVVAAILAAVLAFTLAQMLLNGQIGDTSPLVNTVFHRPLGRPYANWTVTNYSYDLQTVQHHDSSISLVLTLVGICESLIVLLVVVSTVIRIFSDGDDA